VSPLRLVRLKANGGLEAGGNIIVFSLSGSNTVQQSVSCEQADFALPQQSQVPFKRISPESRFSAAQLSILGFGLILFGGEK